MSDAHLDTLRANPLFRELAPEQIAELAACAEAVRFPAGSLIFREGGDASAFYLIEYGQVTLETAAGAARLTITTLGEGEVLGWSWLFVPYRWHFDARATTLVRATAFDAACVRALCEADPPLGYVMMKRFARVIVDRLQSTRLQLLDLYGSGGTRHARLR